MRASTWTIARWHFSLLELVVIGVLLLVGWASGDELEELEAQRRA
jgi:hypothetical protein